MKRDEKNRKGKAGKTSKKALYVGMSSEEVADLCVALVERSQDPVLITQGEKILFVNQALTDLLGYTSDKARKMKVMDLIAPEDREAVAKRIKLRYGGAKGLPKTMSMRLLRSDGTYVHTENSSTVITYRDKPALVAIVRDVTERRDSEDMFRELVELSPDSIIIMQGTKIVFVNDAYTRLFGYKLKELADLPIEDHIAPEDRKRAMQRMKERYAGEKGLSKVLDIKLLKKDGGVVPSETTSSIINYNGKPALMALIRDVSERTHAHALLRESEEMFRNLSEESPNMIFINVAGRVVYVNEKCEKMMGYSKEQICSSGFNFLKLIAPEYHKVVLDNFKKHMQGADLPPYEYVLVTARGERIDAVISSALIKYENKTAILGIVTDVTKMKQAEGQLKDLTVELEGQRAALEEKNVALKEVLAGIEEEKLAIKKQVNLNADKLLMPVIRMLRNKASMLGKEQLAMLETSIRDLTRDHDDGMSSLTPREFEVANLIRGGMNSKEIADLTGVSLRTIETHRNNIRRKLKISGRAQNLVTFLRRHQ